MKDVSAQVNAISSQSHDHLTPTSRAQTTTTTLTVQKKSWWGFLAAILLGLAPQSQADVKSTYVDSCAACHDSGALNAPIKGDKARWALLKQKKGMSGLVRSVKSGMTQMPAGGLCDDCRDQDYRDLIYFMSQ